MTRVSARRRRILLVRLDHAGDCVLTVPGVADAIRRAAPASRLTAMVTSVSGPLVRDHPAIDRVVEFDAPWSIVPRGRRRRVRLARYLEFAGRRLLGDLGRHDDVVFLSFSAPERALLVGAGRRRLGFLGPYRARRHRLAARLLTDGVQFDLERHVLDNCYRLASRLVPLGSPPLRSPLQISDRALSRGRAIAGRHRDGDRRLVVMHVGHPQSMKSWSGASFSVLARRLAEEQGVTCLLLTDPDSAEFSRRVCAEADHTRVRHTTTDTLLDLAGLISDSDLFVSNDGAPAHIAASLGRPSLALFGPTDERVYRPLGDHAHVIRRDHPEAPCAYPWGRKPTCCEAMECLRGLPVDDVHRAAVAILDGTVGDDACRDGIILS